MKASESDWADARSARQPACTRARQCLHPVTVLGRPTPASRLAVVRSWSRLECPLRSMTSDAQAAVAEEADSSLHRLDGRDNNSCRHLSSNGDPRVDRPQRSTRYSPATNPTTPSDFRSFCRSWQKEQGRFVS